MFKKEKYARASNLFKPARNTSCECMRRGNNEIRDYGKWFNSIGVM